MYCMNNFIGIYYYRIVMMKSKVSVFVDYKFYDNNDDKVT